MTNVLITGGAGFIGSTFVERLFESRPETNITVLDALTYAGSLDNIPEAIRNSPRFSFVHASINDAGVIKDAVSAADQVVHFAAETHVARSLESDRVFFETDVLGTQCLANAVVHWGSNVERFVHIFEFRGVRHGRRRRDGRGTRPESHKPVRRGKGGGRTDSSTPTSRPTTCRR